MPRVKVGAGDARALTAPELRALEKATDRLASSRDRAVMQVLLRTGLRIGELAALDRGDVQLTQRTGQLVVRHGKGDRYRVVPLSRSAHIDGALRARLPVAAPGTSTDRREALVSRWPSARASNAGALPTAAGTTEDDQ